MVKISAFKSLRPIQDIVSKVPTQTYGTYSQTDINKETEKNPYSFLNIINQDYEKNLQKRFKIIREKIIEFKNKNIFETEKKETLYIYRQVKQKMEFTGFICAIDLKDYKNNRIKIHEKTIKKRELLFAKYLSITKIHAEPVLITYDSNGNDIIEKYRSTASQLYDFKTNDGVQHKIWKIQKSKEIQDIITYFKKINNAYIADGHHRMASSLTNLEDQKNQQCLAYIVPKIQLKTYPFHRVLCSKLASNQVLKKIRKLHQINKIKNPKLNSKSIQFYINQNWYRISKQTTQLNNELLVNQLLQHILKPVFNIRSERTNKNIRFIPGTQPLKSITTALNANEILFLMNTIDVNLIMSMANKNKTTPPKSTFILPKLPSGLIMMELK